MATRLVLFLLASSRGWASCAPSGRGSPRLAIGDSTWVCVVLANTLDWRSDAEYVRFAFELKLDDYSRVKVRNAWNQPPVNGSGLVSLHVQSERRVSYQKRWRHDGRTFPFLAVVIKVQNGRIAAVAWDDACYDCRKDCSENSFDFDGSKYKHADKQCYYDDDDCRDGADSIAKLCELAIFVSWSGTDKSDRPLLSQQKRFSRFDPADVSVYLKDLKSTSVKVGSGSPDYIEAQDDGEVVLVDDTRWDDIEATLAPSPLSLNVSST